MIDIKGITKSFGSLQVLKGIDLHIDKGEVVSIVGPSGAGKTTLLQIIGTLDKPDSGSIMVDGIDVSSLSTKKLSQHINFFVAHSDCTWRYKFTFTTSSSTNFSLSSPLWRTS